MVPGVGLQLTTHTRAGGARTSRLVDAERVGGVVLNEALSLWRAYTYLVVVDRGDPSQLFAAFEALDAPLDELLEAVRVVREALGLGRGTDTDDRCR